MRCDDHEGCGSRVMRFAEAHAVYKSVKAFLYTCNIGWLEENIWNIEFALFLLKLKFLN